MADRPGAPRSATFDRSFLIHLPKCVADAIALEPCVPRGLAVDARMEQIIVELFTIEECAVRRAADEAPPGRPL
jgi:hypothetical protein